MIVIESILLIKPDTILESIPGTNQYLAI